MSFRGGQVIHIAITKLLLISIVLFGAGPQFGSLDADRDGSPEVPIIVLNTGNEVNVLPTVTRIHESSSVSRLAPLLSVQVPSRLLETTEKQSESHLGHPSLLSFGLLRC